MSKLYEIIEKPLSGEWGSDDEAGTGIPVLRTTNFTNIGAVDYSNVVTRKIDAKKTKEKFLRKGDIIIEKSGGSPAQPVGRVVLFEGEDNKYLFNNFTSVLRVKDKNTYFSKYLFYNLFSNYKMGVTRKFQNKTTGILNLKLDRFVMETEIKHQPLDTQKKIYKTLDTAAELLALRKQQLVELDNLIKSTFYDTFGDPVTNKKGWEFKKLAELLVDVKNGITRRGKENSIGSIVLKLKDIKENYIDFNDMNKFVLNQKESTLFQLALNQLLFIRVNGNPDYVGRCAVFNGFDQSVYYNDHIMRVTLKDEIVNTAYLCRLLNLPYGKKEIKNHLKTSAGQYTINQQGLSNMIVPVPPLSLQTQFAFIVTKIEEQKALVHKAIDESQYLFDSLMSEYFE